MFWWFGDKMNSKTMMKNRDSQRERERENNKKIKEDDEDVQRN